MKQLTLCRAAAAALCLLLLAGCGAASSGPASSAGGASAAATAPADSGAACTFTDDLGREVTLEAAPRRVAALTGSYADIWCTAGGRDTLVASASDAWTDFDLGLGEEVANIGGAMGVSVEELLAAAPDLVLASTNIPSNQEMLPALEAAGVDVAFFSVDTFEDYLRMLEICTGLTGSPEAYQTYGEAVAEEIEAARARAAAALEEQGPEKVLYIRAAASVIKPKGSSGTVLGEMLADLGCINIADQDQSLLEDLSMEAILAADPDKILIVLQGADPEPAKAQLEGEVLSNPAWQQLTAVREGRVYYMDKDLYHLKPNARWGEAYDHLVEILYGV
ncbi:MAG TPA: ABC transporter substrate-binding protein [Candidatus Faecalibacterium faecigallinarum]|uniref:ABC transporter substrate-binding protein n=1 Tax=Candidatus Faecalibacterium faecigallinarum TaxID=2838577 RepID=A0A9D2P793_9FIRM|nr:ABC transporter substrate-binding protein [Candidatus Faecalibacterium faecigallinarum]